MASQVELLDCRTSQSPEWTPPAVAPEVTTRNNWVITPVEPGIPSLGVLAGITASSETHFEEADQGEMLRLCAWILVPPVLPL